jgi:hypothetical protein
MTRVKRKIILDSQSNYEPPLKKRKITIDGNTPPSVLALCGFTRREKSKVALQDRDVKWHKDDHPVTPIARKALKRKA